MSTDLTAMTATELVAELAKHRNTKDLGIRLAMIGIRAELDARCEKWKFGRAGDNGISFDDSEMIRMDFVEGIGYIAAIEDTAEFHALLGYLIAKGDKE